MEIRSLFIRYIILLLIALPNLAFFYLILTPLTFYPVYWILSSIYTVTLSTSTQTATCLLFSSTKLLSSLSSIACLNTTIILKGYFANIIPACIAGSAYYLLLILNLTTPMGLNKRIKSILFMFFSLLALNILRIVSFAILFVKKGYGYFDVAHLTTWYFGSTVLVVLIWFINVLIFKIDKIPIYTDIKNLYNSKTNNEYIKWKD